MQLRLSSFLKLTTCAVLLIGSVGLTHAADSKATGTWTWTMQGRARGGQGGGDANAQPPARKFSLKLKADGEKLTGTLTSPAFGGRGGQGGGQNAQPRETEISDGKVKGDEISFSVKREFQGNSFVTKYSGKIDGDTIKGKTEFDRNGEAQSRDWEAKREAAEKK